MNDTPTILVIVGISGDLSTRKLLPAIEKIAKANQLPEHFHVVGITRQPDLKLDSLISTEFSFVHSHTSLFTMDLNSSEAYDRLGKYLTDIESRFGTPAQRLFYLSVPPKASHPVVEILGRTGLAKAPNTKLLLEKPFGTDLTSAQELIESTNHFFSEEQIYRIDHYLAKEMLIFRSGNSLFKRTWNNEFIHKIEIIMSETLDIENRAVFYEQTGALRDIVQSHLLQLTAITLMELPTAEQLVEVPAKRLEALESLSIVGTPTRGQYIGYTAEVGNASSTTETFVSLTLVSNNPRWRDVPITLTTGKALDTHTTEIRVYYKQDEASEADQLTLSIQPKEGAAVNLWAKKPGYDNQLESVKLTFDYPASETLPDAYERVLLDAMRSDHTLFTSSQEVLASWNILKPLQEKWQSAGDYLKLYSKGSRIEDITQSPN